MADVTLASVEARLRERFPDLEFHTSRGQLAVLVPKAQLTEVARFLKDDPQLAFNYLTDITGVDYLKMDREPRFEVVTQLYSFAHNLRLRLKVGVEEDDMHLPSLTTVWKAANWLEREAFEMFGFRFDGHPDLRRLLLPDIFDGFPLRKDYPLRGRGERDVIIDLK